MNKIVTFAKEHEFELIGYYDKVINTTHIKGKCKTVDCENEFDKRFRQLKEIGPYCSICTEVNRQEKIKSTNMKKFGVECVFQSQEIKEKSKKTNMKNLGVENPMQSKEVQEIHKQSCLENLGVENPMQNEEIKEKSKQTCLKIYGNEYVLQNKDIREKIKNTNMKNLGVECVFESEEIKQKSKNTNMKNLGVENPGQSKEVQEKSKQTSIKKYGTEYPMQNPIVSEKSSKNAYMAYDYKLPSGKILRLQGYENHGLELLLEKYDEDDIVNERSKVPELFWKDSDNIKHRYFVDFYIEKHNKCIEIKSTWTFEKNKEKCLLKQKYAKQDGYKYQILVFDKKGKLVEKIL